MKKPIFISYRRDDSAAEALAIASALRSAHGAEGIFLDSASIEPGTSWPAELEKALRGARTVLVVIGPDWQGKKESGQRRIDETNDWVRNEVSIALAEEKLVIPLLVKDASLPVATDLPDDLNSLSTRQAIPLRRDFWDHDLSIVLRKRILSSDADRLRLSYRLGNQVYSLHHPPSGEIGKQLISQLRERVIEGIEDLGLASRRELSTLPPEGLARLIERRLGIRYDTRAKSAFIVGVYTPPLLEHQRSDELRNIILKHLGEIIPGAEASSLDLLVQAAVEGDVSDLVELGVSILLGE
jgi:hypothetical protein